MHTRKLGPDLSVSAIGLGCMGMSHAYGGQPENESIDAIHRALDIGITFLDTAEVYGPFANEKLLGKALKGRRDQAVVATKFGFNIEKRGDAGVQRDGVNSRPEHVRKVADECLSRLGIEMIDLFYQHRVDPDVPIEDTIGAVVDLIKDGKVRAIGMSEAGVGSIRRAHAVHPISALQYEYSLWTRDPEAEIIPLCEELGIGFVPFSPLGRGQLAGSVTSLGDLSEGDMRRKLPRFQEEAMAANVALAGTLKAIADGHGVTSAQLALAWALNRKPFIVPIPGARKIRHIEENAAAADIELSQDELRAIEDKQSAVVGARYTPEQLAMTGR